MAWTALKVEKLGDKFKDLRKTISGNSETWAWVQPLSNFVGIAVHHSAGTLDQTPEQIAQYHINHNKWGGIGYHFLVDKDGNVYYVGDLATARAHVANMNDKYIGICLIGDFRPEEDGQITKEMKFSLQELCRKLIEDYPALTNISDWKAIKGHKEVPQQSTSCPASVIDFVNKMRDTNGNAPTSGGSSSELTLEQILALEVPKPNFENKVKNVEFYFREWEVEKKKVAEKDVALTKAAKLASDWENKFKEEERLRKLGDKNFVELQNQYGLLSNANEQLKKDMEKQDEAMDILTTENARLSALQFTAKEVIIIVFKYVARNLDRIVSFIIKIVNKLKGKGR